MDKLFIAITRLYGANEWREMSSAELAQLVAAPRYFRSMTLVAFFQECVARGALTADLRKIYQFGQYKLDVQFVIEQSGAYADLATVQAMFALMPFDVSQATSDAIAATIAAHTARLVDVVANELGEDAPQTVTADDVDTALGRK